MIRVHEIMTERVCTLSQAHTLADARALMAQKRIRHIPIVDEEKRIIGLVTHRDILAYGVTPNTGSLQNRQEIEQSILLAEVMVQGVKTITKEHSLRIAALLMEQHRFGCLPVVDEDKKVVGIITDTDFVGLAVNLLEQLEATEIAEEEW